MYTVNASHPNIREERLARTYVRPQPCIIIVFSAVIYYRIKAGYDCEPEENDVILWFGEIIHSVRVS